MEEQLEELFNKYAVRPTLIKVNPKLIEHLREHRPGGGNSRQRRAWRRKWSVR